MTRSEHLNSTLRSATATLHTYTAVVASLLPLISTHTLCRTLPQPPSTSAGCRHLSRRNESVAASSATTQHQHRILAHCCANCSRSAVTAAAAHPSLFTGRHKRSRQRASSVCLSEPYNWVESALSPSALRPNFQGCTESPCTAPRGHSNKPSVARPRIPLFAPPNPFQPTFHAHRLQRRPRKTTGSEHSATSRTTCHHITVPSPIPVATRQNTVPPPPPLQLCLALTGDADAQATHLSSSESACSGFGAKFRRHAGSAGTKRSPRHLISNFTLCAPRPIPVGLPSSLCCIPGQQRRESRH